MSYPELAIHTITTKPWSVYQCIEAYASRGIGGITLWRQSIEHEDLKRVRRQIQHAGIQGISLVRGGFFTGINVRERQLARQDNLTAIRQAATLGLSSLILVCGATVGLTPRENYLQIKEGILGLADLALEEGVKLLIEPLHPVYAGNRSAICSLAVANQLCAEIEHENVGIALDVYHTWWELDLELQIQRAAQRQSIGAYHICDFKTKQSDVLNDRGLMGEGCIALQEIDEWVMQAGFTGMREIEIFSNYWWQRDQNNFLDVLLETYDATYKNVEERKT